MAWLPQAWCAMAFDSLGGPALRRARQTLAGAALPPAHDRVVVFVHRGVCFRGLRRGGTFATNGLCGSCAALPRNAYRITGKAWQTTPEQYPDI